MRILAIDMGTGTQDVLVFDSDRPVENCVKLVLPSATEVAARRIRAALQRRDAPLVLEGVIAGGGPCSWAIEEYLRAGLPVVAGELAAATIDDDLDRVRALGIEVVADEEAPGRAGVHVRLQDIDLGALRVALAAFEEPGHFDGFAIGCLDHGAAPPGTSDRRFRFAHLRSIVEQRNDLLAFASAGDELPPYLTRARAMVATVAAEAPVAFMDTGPAAALGALHDPNVAAAGECLVANLGNMHLLGFHLRGRRIASLFEHHTGEVSGEQIESLLERLADGSLSDADVFGSQGHGAYHADRALVHAALPGMVAATGPLRGKIGGGRLAPYFAAPFGDMMIGGCFGLLRGFASVYPRAEEAIAGRLGALPG